MHNTEIICCRSANVEYMQMLVVSQRISDVTLVKIFMLLHFLSVDNIFWLDPDQTTLIIRLCIALLIFLTFIIIGHIYHGWYSMIASVHCFIHRLQLGLKIGGLFVTFTAHS